jgi:hypothetical protein
LLVVSLIRFVAVLEYSRYPPPLGRFAPPPLTSGFKAKRDHIPPSPDPCARAYGIAMGDRLPLSLLNPAGPIE